MLRTILHVVIGVGHSGLDIGSSDANLTMASEDLLIGPF